MNELGGNKPADRIEMVFAEEMASGLPMDNSSKFIFIADSSADGNPRAALNRTFTFSSISRFTVSLILFILYTEYNIRFFYIKLDF